MKCCLIIPHSPPNVHTHGTSDMLVRYSCLPSDTVQTGNGVLSNVIAIQHGAKILLLKQQFCLYDLSAGVKHNSSRRHQASLLMLAADRAMPAI